MARSRSATARRCCSVTGGHATGGARGPPLRCPPVTGCSAIAFPGQGGDWAAAVRTLEARRDDPLVAALASRLGTARWDELDGLDTRNAQPVIFVAGLVGSAAAGAAQDADVGLA